MLFKQNSLIAQEVHANFWDGAIYLKIKPSAKIALPEFDQNKKQKAEDYPHFAALMQQHQVTRIYKPFTRLKTPYFENLYKIEFGDCEKVSDLITEFQQFQFVEYSEKIPIYKTTAIPNDPAIGRGHLWFLPVVKAYEAWEIAKGSRDVVIAVVDDAVKISHEDLNANIWINANEISNNGIDDDGNGYIDDRVGWDGAHNDNNPNPPANASINFFSHGTHVAGTAGGVTDNGRGIAAISHNVKIMACKGGAPNGLLGIFEALEYAIVNRPDIINCSWGGGDASSVLAALIDEAENRDILVVAAAGNGDTSAPSFPAAYHNTISVASSERNDRRSNFSNYGTTIDIVAPGSDIISCLAEGTTRYFSSFGTSMASPNVCSLLGLMKSHNPNLSARQLKECLLSTADNIDGPNPNFKGLLGAGRINALRAVQCVSGQDPELVCPSPNNLRTGTVSSTTAVLRWDASQNADRYVVQFTSNNSWNTVIGGPINNTSYTLTNLKPNTFYRFRVRALCGETQGNFANAKSFRTSTENCGVPSSLSVNNVTTSSATLKWNNISLANSYEAQSRILGTSSWQDINSNISGTSYNLTDLNAGTGYQFRVRSHCANSTSLFSSPFTFNTQGSSGGNDDYCAAKGNSTDDEWIAQVEIGDFANASGNDGGYGNFTNKTIAVQTDESYTIKLQPAFAGDAYTEHWRIWADLNQDGDFSDTGELLFDIGTASNTVVTDNISIPTTAKVGNTRLRVAMKYIGTVGSTTDDALPESCGTFGFGEVEDYTLNVSAPSSGNGDYCMANGNSTDDEWIQNVTIANLSNNSGNDNGYGDFTNKNIALEKGQSYDFVLTPGFSGDPFTEYWRVWLDLNQDGDFTDAGEQIFDAGQATRETVSGSFTLSNTALTGTTRMRIAMKFYGSLGGNSDETVPNACGTFNFGEVEDYAVTISDVNSGGGSGGAAPEDYCKAKGHKTADEWIETITVGGINNKSGDDGGYGDYTSTITDMLRGTSYQFTLTPGFSEKTYTEYWRIWIDWNRNGDFGDDNELVFDAGQASRESIEASFSVPTNADLGNTRMRIAMKFVGTYSGTTDNKPPVACGSFAYGEVEDYTINITDETSAPMDYCVAKGDDTAEEWIDRIEFANINNRSGADNGYGDFTNITANVAQGNQYEFTLTPGFLGDAYTEHWRVWIDYNQDGDFADTDEQVFDSGNGKEFAVKSSLIIPSTAKIGQTRMRVAMKFVGTVQGTLDETPPSSCGSFPFGEVEDYGIKILENSGNGCNAPMGVSLSDLNSNGATISWQTVTGASSYLARVRAVGSEDWISGTINDLDVSASGLNPCTTYEYQIKAICASGESEFSTRRTFKTAGCPLATCPRPEDLRVSNIGNQSATLTWNTVSGVQEYVVSYRNNSITWQLDTVTNNTYVFQGLVNCLTYEAKVEAICADGNSNTTDIVAFTTDCEACEPPNNLQAVAINGNSANIVWEQASAGLAYELRAREVGVTQWEIGVFEEIGVLYLDLNPCTEYEAQIRSLCDGEESNFSPVMRFQTKGCDGITYCEARGNFTEYEWIKNVRINNIDNFSGSDFGYGDYTHLQTDLRIGENYSISLMPGFVEETFTEYWRIWIDFNGDGDFEDTDELVFDANGTSTEVVNGNILIPSNLADIVTTMRVMMKWVNTNSDPNIPEACTSFDYGEVEDYTVNIARSVGIENASVQPTIQLFPNPNKGTFEVKLEMPQPQDATILIHNLLGQQIYQQRIPAQTHWHERIDLTTQATGMYLLELVVGNQKHTKQLMINNE